MLQPDLRVWQRAILQLPGSCPQHAVGVAPRRGPHERLGQLHVFIQRVWRYASLRQLIDAQPQHLRGAPGQRRCLRAAIAAAAAPPWAASRSRVVAAVGEAAPACCMTASSSCAARPHSELMM